MPRHMFIHSYHRVHSLANHHSRRLFLYGIVGISGLAVNSAILFTLVSYLHLPHIIAAAVSSEASIISNFALNDRVTFHGTHRRGTWRQRLGAYNVVALGGMLISLGFLAILTTTFGMFYLIANLIANGTAIITNYAINSRFIWLGRPAAPVPVRIED